ncbi:hypothetical protein B0H14DRAFT_3152448 [Mycena olivaceomarginata]|nr:hypothetical protein B0H14DRAFT_3152448 [Mycena olivaceomarginata]
MQCCGQDIGRDDMSEEINRYEKAQRTVVEYSGIRWRLMDEESTSSNDGHWRLPEVGILSCRTVGAIIQQHLPMSNSFVVPTSDPYEELLLASRVPSSDLYEEVALPGYSQRDETREAVDAEFRGLIDQANRRDIRRSRFEIKTVTAPNTGSLATAKNSRAAKKYPRLDSLDFDLLRLQCNDLEEARDKAQQECAELRTECTRLRQELDQHRVSLAFFGAETGRWRWAAASAHTKLEKAMRELRAGISGASWVVVLEEFGVCYRCCSKCTPESSKAVV